MEKPQRKSLRLQGYDYSQNGVYFVTTCTHNRELLFGDIGTIHPTTEHPSVGATT